MADAQKLDRSNHHRMLYFSPLPAFSGKANLPKLSAFTLSRGIAACFVELCEAVVAVNDVKWPSQFGQERDCLFPFGSERQARAQCRKLPVGFETAKAVFGFVHGRSDPAQSHRGRTPALHIAGDTTHGAHHISMMLVQAIERRNSAGGPSLLTVRISSNPSRIRFETPGGVSLRALGEIADQFPCIRRSVGFPRLVFRHRTGALTQAR